MTKLSDLILAVNPEMYFPIDSENVMKSKAQRSLLKKLVQEHGLAKGLKEAKNQGVPIKTKPCSSFKIKFDSQQAQLETIYYWVLDFVQDAGWKMEKTVDNFAASPGSGQFSELSMKATKMQEEGMKILGGMNQIIKSILNLVYDLKEFELRLAHYDDAKSSDKKKEEIGILALKQIWLDNVDLKKGRGAIHQMANEMGFTTLREAFMMANSTEDLKKMNSEDKEAGGTGLINDQVMRILIPRISEFNKWREYSEKELRKRFSIEKNYLKSQVETVKLYSSWMKPYLEAAEKLRQKGFDNDAAMANAFSTSMFELQIFGKKVMKVPEKFKSYIPKRNYNQCMVIGVKYRGHVGQRVTQKGDYGFAMGGRIIMTFDAYALNEEEIDLVKKEMKSSDVEDSMIYSQDTAEEAIKDLKEDLDHFLKSDEEKEKERLKVEKEESEDINPFTALLGLFKMPAKKDKKKDKKTIETTKDIKKDNYVETALRASAKEDAGKSAHLVYDIYKKAHGMASAPGEGFTP
jgi:hypothetical protein